MTPQSPKQDAEHLQLLSVFHYVVGALMILAACIPIIHLILGLIMIYAPEKLDAHAEEIPKFVGLMFVGIASVIIVAGWAVGALVLYAGHCLSQRKSRTFCLVIAGIMCLFMPLGTVLGIFTLVVLMRPSVAALFGPSAELGGRELP